MIGTKLYKQDFKTAEYEKMATWCNKNNAMIVDKGEYYEITSCPDVTTEQTPTVDARVAALEDMMNSLMEGGVPTNG